METEALINEVLFAPAPRDASWGRPTFYSFASHAALALLLPLFYWEAAPPPAPPIRVVEIHVMGRQDLALKGTAHDFSHGPLPDKDLMSRPSRGKKARGTPHSVRTSPAAVAQAAPPAPMPKLQSRGPLFRSGGTGSAADSPAGRDRIYAASGAIRTDSPQTKSGATGVAGAAAGSAGASAGSSRPRGGTGAARGLIAAGPLFGTASDGAGGTGETLRVRGYSERSLTDKNAGSGVAGGGGRSAGRPDQGVEGSGEGDGSGNTLGGGRGSINGGERLERQGTAIVVDYPLETGGLAQPTRAAMAVPQTSGDFFAITGSLSHRRILKMRLPRYPRWAEEKGLETSVSVWLAATAQGNVEDNLYIAQTSGYPELDRIVLEAVKNILFAALPDQDSLREDSGVATFNFKLKKNRGNEQ